MHVQPISTFRLFQEGHLLRNSIAIFVLTTLFYFIGAELRLVHELSLFWPLNGVMAGVFARYVWLNRLHYYAISYVAMLVYDAITTEWGLVSLAINFSNMMFIVTVALLVARDKRLGKNKYEPVSALRLFNYCLLAALLCAIVGAIGSVSIDTLDFWPLLADWFSEQFSTGVLIVPCMLTLAIPGVLPRFKAEQMMPAIALIVSVIASVVIGGAGSLAFPLPALIWCAVRYTPQVTCLLTFVTGAVEVVLVANSVIDISVGSPFSIPQMFSARLGIATMAICPIMVSFSVAAINSLMKQVALRAELAVERFDRRWNTERTVLLRLPQEDMCQTFGLPSSVKYESDGGPGIAQIMAFLMGSSEALKDRYDFMKFQVFQWLIGATDGHAKNFSVFIQAGGSYRLTPFYDIISAFPVLGGTGIHISDLKLAMGLNASKGKKTAIDKIYPRHFLATAKVLKFPEVQMHEILSDFARMIPAALDNVKTSLPTDFPENVVTAVETNVLRLHDRLSREYGIK
ncbi:HipA domain-containing protein [Escherichia coli]|nr:HipA domain-containing protein [Escherichia coli]